jgi:dipeptidase E
VKRARDSLVDAGITVTLLDLRECRGEKGQNELRQVLGVADVVWIGGGNIFYLNWLLKDTGARDIIIEYAKNGNVVAGGSAGAIVAGPTIETFEAADDASAAPSVICDALALTATVVLPHWGREDYGSAMERIAKQLTARSYVVQPLTDREALVINGSSRRIVGA